MNYCLMCHKGVDETLINGVCITCIKKYRELKGEVKKWKRLISRKGVMVGDTYDRIA
jgi:hypothetical protein